MADWPSIRKSDWLLFKEKQKKRQIRTPFEAGYVHSRAGVTQMKREFSIGWNWLLRTDYVLLVTFFNSYQGSTFNFTHIISSTVYVVGFMDDELPEAEPMGTLYVKLDGIRLEER